MHKDNVTKRAFKLYSSFNRKYFPMAIFQIFLQQLSPFFNLWMSAEIVTALYEGRERQTVFILVAVALVGNLIIRIMDSALGRAVGIQLEILNNNEASAFNKKTLSLDYDKLENPELRTLRRKVKENSWINGYGIVNMRNTILGVVSSAISVIFSLIFFAEMLSLIIKTEFNWLVIIFLIGMILCIALNYIWGFKIGMKRASLSKKIGDMMLNENRLAVGYHTTGMDNRIYRQQDKLNKLNEKVNKDHLRAFTEVQRFRFTTDLPLTILNWSSTLFSYFIVCLYCTLGAFPVGSVIKYTGYLGRFIRDLSNLLNVIFHSFKENEPFLKVYLEYFDIPNDMYQGSLTVEKRSDKKYDIEFRNVSFKYAGSENYALKNVNLRFNVGERLAVVGMNGSGKTTFIKLMCRLYDPTEGEILMNDFNIRKYDYRQYLDVFSVVFQDYSLLALPLGNNVASAATWNEEKAERCLREVGFGERYDKMPKKLETPLYKNFDNEGVNISGGEAQKIALARALYKDAPFIILDEPTAALDPIAEAEIYAKFDEIVGDKTAIYISHRLSSCRFCDKIVVFDNGEIVQVGTHDELLTDENGKYYELWHAQAQYYAK